MATAYQSEMDHGITERTLPNRKKESNIDRGGWASRADRAAGLDIRLQFLDLLGDGNGDGKDFNGMAVQKVQASEQQHERQNGNGGAIEHNKNLER
jgi:hypothetical protein